ncbi:MAG: LysR family transcriptional regulator [Xenococcaceae cyanobacterium MO_188.B29]|nr:LysR family transcriptional regulator [Xenococcaceae cyanobacterium MO_188.B29]
MSGIHHVNLAAVDLNLLVVFDALMSERNVTRAGEKIGLSQPATSNALSRLRNLFQDDLLVRTATGMQPTPKAISLSLPIRQILLQIQSSLEQDTPFVPENSDRLFTIGTSDYGEFILISKLMQKLEIIAPTVKIRVRSLFDMKSAYQMLDSDKIDLAIGYFPEWPSWQEAEVLFEERFVGVCSADNPKISDKVTLEDYLSVSHLLVSPYNEDMTGWVDHALERQNLQRHVAISVPHFLVAPFIIANTDLVVTLAERVAKIYVNMLKLRTFSLPLASEGFAMTMLWHTKDNNDSAHLWLRNIISSLSTD